MARASCAEQTTPSIPARLANRASATAREPSEPAIPICRKVTSSKLVSTVTASNFGPLLRFPAASRAACIPASPFAACSVSRRTFGSLTAADTAFETVFGMSWNFRSRKISALRLASLLTACGPSEVKSWAPTLNKTPVLRRSRANAAARPRVSTSRATISRGELCPAVWAPVATPDGLWRARAGQSQAFAPLRKKRPTRGPRRMARDH